MAIAKKIFSILTTAVLALIIVLSAFLYVGKMTTGKTTLFGNELMVVLSGSMSPTFETGSIVAVKPVDFASIQKGDIITFRDSENRTVTHRVVEIKGDKLVTKGDANDGNDLEPVTKDHIIGKVQYWVPLIGYVIHYVQSKVGILLFLGLPGLYLIVSQVWKLFAMLNERERMKSGDLNTEVHK